MDKTTPLRHGLLYHVYNRGVNREDLFKEERNYPYFLKLIRRHIHPVADIYAYCLLRNHFHLLLRIRMRSEIRKSAAEPLHNLQLGRHFGNCFNAYTKSVNAAYRRTGCLFERPFKRKHVESSDYFRQLIVYIHRNPQKHGLVDNFVNWPHSSFTRYEESDDPVIECSTVVSSFGSLDAFRGAHLGESASASEISFGDFTDTDAQDEVG